MSKLIPILNVSAFAEGYFQKSATLGVPPEEALGLYMTKRASGFWPWVSRNSGNLALGGLVSGGVYGFGKDLLGGAKDVGGAVVSGAANLPNTAAGAANSTKDILMMLGAGGAGVGGLAWLLKQNAEAAAKKKIATQQAAGKMQAQQKQLQQAFAVAPEEKVKSYTTVGQDNYEV
jgi:hypothetical protein